MGKSLALMVHYGGIVGDHRYSAVGPLAQTKKDTFKRAHNYFMDRYTFLYFTEGKIFKNFIKKSITVDCTF